MANPNPSEILAKIQQSLAASRPTRSLDMIEELVAQLEKLYLKHVAEAYENGRKAGLAEAMTGHKEVL